MNQCISSFELTRTEFEKVSISVQSGWNDEVMNHFYNEIIYPMQADAKQIKSSMDELSAALQRIKEEIDSI